MIDPNAMMMGPVPACQIWLPEGLSDRRMKELLHGDNRWLAGPAAPALTLAVVPGGITSEQDEGELEALNQWVEDGGLPRGAVAHDFADAETGEQRAVFDLAWPNVIQEELSQPVAAPERRQ